MASQTPNGFKCGKTLKNSQHDGRRKRREKQKAKRKKGGGKKAATVSIDEDNGANWELILLVAVGIFCSFQALDMDVLLGILFMPFTKTMQYLRRNSITFV